jgi:hypothetical protein
MATRIEGKKRFQIEKLEERIAPTACYYYDPYYVDPYKVEVQEKGNNGVGNGLDGQPPGNPPINDGPGTSPGNPGNRFGQI